MCTDPKEEGFSEVSLLKEPLPIQCCGLPLPAALAGANHTAFCQRVWPHPSSAGSCAGPSALPCRLQVSQVTGDGSQGLT